MSSLRSPRLTSTLSRAVLCNQHHAEPRLALHHAGVSIRRVFERHCLDHRSDVLQDTEGERILPINRRSRQTPVDQCLSVEAPMSYLDRCADSNMVTSFLTRLSAAKYTAFEFLFRLEPIVHVLA